MIERFKNIFTGLERAHGVTIAEDTNGNGTKIKGKSFVKRQPVTDELWQKHLEGKENLGIIPINDDNQCRWGCIDIDSYAGFDHKKLIDKITNMNLVYHCECVDLNLVVHMYFYLHLIMYQQN